MSVIFDLKSMNLSEIEAVISSLNQPKFRSRQVFEWLLKGVNSFEEMKNVPKTLLDELKKEHFISYCNIEKKFESKLDETVKYLFSLYDGELIESVVMKYKHGYSICVSSQVGCNMGCKFCASTIDGKKRNLTAGEILSQIHTASKDLGVRISNVVMMGMGEPLDNFDEVIKFLELVGIEGGLNIGILGEYDALKDLGHGCGHHMQTPAAIGAAVAIKKTFEDSTIPFTITVYGTPAEETTGGKIIMAKNGCFNELDIALSTHAARKEAFVGAKSMALRSFNVTYKGKSSHAAGSPYLGRSAADAMFLSFNGIEFMREHVKDGSRMHYTIKEALGPSNIVPAEAKCAYTLRSYDNEYINELEERFRKIVQGACLMTETEAEIMQTTDYAARKGNKVLADLAHKNLDELGIACEENFLRDSSG